MHGHVIVNESVQVQILCLTTFVSEIIQLFCAELN